MRWKLCLAGAIVAGCAANEGPPPTRAPAPPPPAPLVVTMHVRGPREPIDAARAESSRKAKRAPDPASACGANEVYVPPTGASGFVMGNGFKTGAHTVILTRGFCMDANETTVREYQACVDAKACEVPWTGDPYSMYPKFPDHPVNMVTWPAARVYCAWAGKRLPTEAEWEWAATGPEQSKYPWGDEPGPDCERGDYTHWGAPKWNAGGDVGCHGGGPSPVGAHPKGDRVWPSGHIHDLAGNVWEWVEDAHKPYPSDPQTDPLVVDSTSSVHVIRSGAWNRSYAAMEVTYRASATQDYAVPAIGVRCVRTAP